MTEISFYHLAKTPIEKALPKLLEKIISQGLRVLVLTSTSESVEILATQLWTYHPNSFLPHGTHKDGFTELQPIFISHQEENPNFADVLVVLDGRIPSFISKFKRALDLFEGTDEEDLNKAETRWTFYAKENHALAYWTQTADGTWQKTKG